MSATTRCPRCRKDVRLGEMRDNGTQCRHCAFKVDAQVAVLVKDRDLLDQAYLDHRNLSVVTLAAMGGWEAEYEMLKGAFG